MLKKIIHFGIISLQKPNLEYCGSLALLPMLYLQHKQSSHAYVYVAIYIRSYIILQAIHLNTANGIYRRWVGWKGWDEMLDTWL